MPTPIERDPAVDLVKAFCLLVVVGLHAMMAGVTKGENGLTITNALAGHPIFAWSTWVVQVMPLFFLLGGFSSLTQWRRMRADGTSAGDYIRQRVERLARPALLPLGLVGATLAVLTLTGIPSDVLTQVGFRIGQPLWFLAVYLGCSGFVPLMTRLHEAAPRTTVLVLLGGAILVDVLSRSLSLPLLGAVNFMFVWLFVQQLGFWYADGWVLQRRRWVLLLVGVGSFGVLALLTSVGGYSVDMYVNLNPPTICILVLGIGQLALFSWMHPWLAKLARVPVLRRYAGAVNRNSMTIYLWHVPVAVLVALVTMLVGLPLPGPLSAEWWQTRPLFLGTIAVALFPVVVLVNRFDRGRNEPPCIPMSTPFAALKVVLAVAGVGMILVAGFTPPLNALIGVGLLVIAVWLRTRREPAEAGSGVRRETGRAG